MRQKVLIGVVIFIGIILVVIVALFAYVQTDIVATRATQKDDLPEVPTPKRTDE
jgi:uncharacterized protein YpmB